MGIGDIRYTVLEIVNEVQRKLGLSPTSSLTTNSLAIQLVDFINDVTSDISDFGNWQETIVSANITAVSGQANYSITTSANIKNIGDIYFLPRNGKLRFVTIEDMRIMTRVTSFGAPSQFTLFGTDAGGNPIIRVRPTPASNEDGKLFSVIYWTSPIKYSTADAALRVPFAGDLVVAGVMAKAVLNESGGSPTDKYTVFQKEYLDMRKEVFNRFQGDTGWSTSFRPSMRGRRK